MQMEAWLVWIVITIILFTIITLLLFSKIRLHVNYKRLGGDDLFFCKVSVWQGLVQYKVELPFIETKKVNYFQKLLNNIKSLSWPVIRPSYKIRMQLKDKKGQLLERKKTVIRLPDIYEMPSIIKHYIRKAKEYKSTILYLLKGVHVCHFKWSTELGNEDPFESGILTGLTWWLKGMSIICISHYIIFEGKPELAVKPSFFNKNLNTTNTTFDCIMEIKIGRLAMAGYLYFVRKISKYK